MLFRNNNLKPRKKSYYVFSKDYPSKTGNTYEIGESRTKRLREEKNRRIFLACLVPVFVIAFIATSVAIAISRRPIEENNIGQAAVYDGQLKAYYMPENALDGGIAYTFFKDELAKSRCNAVVINFKTADGRLHYNSRLDITAETGAAESAYNSANEVISQLKAEGYKIIARVYCFEDTLAASKMKNAAITLEDEKTVWLDASAQRDGNPWLNPYSETAREYLFSILSECKDVGADIIMLCSANFPDSDRLDSAVFIGEKDSGESRNAVLHSFVSEAAERLGDVPLAYSLTCENALVGNDRMYEGSMLDSEALFCAVDFRVSKIGAQVTVGDRSYKKDEINEGFYIGKAVPILKARLDDNFSTKAMLPIITNREYIETLEKLGINNYIFINQDDLAEF
ncbi:MAG: hypothetical protein IJL63_05055 [Clostridia bacterium]|nr:hypothetical protein [Clostridia bacterium]